MGDTSTIDVARAVREIEDEVRRKRATGELPKSLEQQLDLDFARYAPAGAVGTDLEHVLARVEQRSHIDVNPPLEGRMPGFVPMKKVLRKVMRWYVRAIAEQASAFASACSRALNMLTDRVKKVERSVGSEEVMRLVESEYARVFRPDAASIDTVVAALSATPGRVLHASANDGWLLEVLRQRGIDSYGVEPDLATADLASAKSLDVRPDVIEEHIASLDKNSLAALVLSGCTDFESVGARNHLLTLAFDSLADNAILALIGSEPDSWSKPDFQVVRDLAPGQPFALETWQGLFVANGFVIDRAESHGVSYVVIGHKPPSVS